MMNNNLAKEFQNGHAYVSMETLTMLSISGADRIAVLNNLCTADLKKLPPEYGTEAFVTDVRGRTLGHGLFFNLAERVLFVGVAGQAEPLSNHIDRYVIREDVVIEDQTSATACRLIHGADSSAIKMFPIQENHTLGTRSVGESLPAGLMLQVPWTSESDTLVLVDQSSADSLDAWLEDQGLQVTSNEAFQAARIEQGWPLFGIDASDANLPQEVSRDAQAISFTKGCYLGQETVARLDALGQVQKKLVRMRINGEAVPESGVKLTDGEKDCGEIRSAAKSLDGEAIIALGYVRRKWFDPGSVLALSDSGQEITVI